MDAGLKEVSDGEVRLRDERAMLAAQTDLSKADEMGHIGEWLRAGGADEPTERTITRR